MEAWRNGVYNGIVSYITVMKLETNGAIQEANRIYAEKLKSRLEPEHLGEIVAIHIRTGDGFLGPAPSSSPGSSAPCAARKSP